MVFVFYQADLSKFTANYDPISIVYLLIGAVIFL